MSFLLFAAPTEKSASEETLIRIRATLYTIIDFNQVPVLYGPDKNIVLAWKKARDAGNEVEERLHLHTWTHSFHIPKFCDSKNKHCLPRFSHVESYLTICVGSSPKRKINMIILFSKCKQLKKPQVQEYRKYVKENKFDICLLIAENSTSHAKNSIQQTEENQLDPLDPLDPLLLEDDKHGPEFKCIPHEKLLVHWFDSDYVPPYVYLTPEEAKEKLDERGIKDPDKCPRLLNDDSVCLQTFARKGDYLECTELSITGGTVQIIKLVV
jgi:DNA-directed RNA polymerase subunit H (RpoH/RPB5)